MFLFNDVKYAFWLVFRSISAFFSCLVTSSLCSDWWFIFRLLSTRPLVLLFNFCTGGVFWTKSQEESPRARACSRDFFSARAHMWVSLWGRSRVRPPFRDTHMAASTTTSRMGWRRRTSQKQTSTKRLGWHARTISSWSSQAKGVFSLSPAQISSIHSLVIQFGFFMLKLI